MLHLGVSGNIQWKQWTQVWVGRKLIINLVHIDIQQKEQKTLIGLFKPITKGEHKSIS